MGGAVSSGRDNDELVDNLMGSNYIRSPTVEKVFRVLDRADFMTTEARDQAYRDLAWRNGPLHLSAPCIYSEVMEGLELRPGLSFLNIGSGTGYLSTMVGLIVGSSGISHGIEVHPSVVDYCTQRLEKFLDNSPIIDEFDFCKPKYFTGNGLCLAPLQVAYDRVYCGAGCPEEYLNYMKQLIKVGGILVMPLNDNLIQMRRTSENDWNTRNLHHVSFATLRTPSKEESTILIKLDELSPPKLQVLCRRAVRITLFKSVIERNPGLSELEPRERIVRPTRPRRICIPIEDDSDVEGLNALHDLDRATGANEMNALLSLVLSMGHNRVAGALRFDTMSSHSNSSTDDEAENGNGDGNGGDGGPIQSHRTSLDDGDEDGNGGGAGGNPDQGPRPAPAPRNNESNDVPARMCRGVLTLEFQDTPQPFINLARQTPDFVINNTENSTIVTAGFTRTADKSVGTVATFNNKLSSTNSKHDKSTKTDGGTTSGKDNAKANEENAAADVGNDKSSSDNNDQKSKSLKSKITMKKAKTDTKDAQTESTDTNTGSSSSDNDTQNDGQKETQKENAGSEDTNTKKAADVEIYLASKSGTGTSYKTEMDWEDTVEIEIESSEGDVEGDSKQQKVDSGIGEETSPTETSGSSPDKTDANEDSEMDGPSDLVSDDVSDADKAVDNRRRQQKRAHGQVNAQSTSTTDEEESPGKVGTPDGGRRRCKRRATPQGPQQEPPQQQPQRDPQYDFVPCHLSNAHRRRRPRSDSIESDYFDLAEARREQISSTMKRDIKYLPLPFALKHYVNFNRIFHY